jgi:hypothetical protein
MSNVAANMNTRKAAGSGNNMIVSVIVIILVLIGLYYLYQFLYGSPSSQATVNILSSPTSATATSTYNGVDVVASSSLKGIVDGGAYTASMWVYVNSTVGVNRQTSPLVHLFDISNKGVAAVTAASGVVGVAGVPAGDTMLFIGLNPRNGSLIVRQSTAEDSYRIDNTQTSLNNTGTKFVYPLSKLLADYNTGDTYTKDDRCDIVNGIEYQRWVLITVVANGRTLDVYIDGKLARSCVYKANYAINSASGAATAYVGAGNAGAFKGFFSNINYANYAYTPDAIWALYQAGPGATFSLSTFFGNLFSTNVSFGTTGALAAKSS